jgi:hypothetical protein
MVSTVVPLIGRAVIYRYNTAIKSCSKITDNVLFSDKTHTDIEGFCYNNPKYIEDVVISAIIDLYFFQRSSIIIGPIFLSAFSYCGYILSCGYNRQHVDFIDPTTNRKDVENISLI